MSIVSSEASSPRTLTDYIYGQLREDIIQGKLAPDTKLKIDPLRTTYSVGATPLREALSRLSSDGFVITEGQRGFRVAPISPQDLDDITDLRLTLELKALTNSLKHGNDAWEARVVSSYYQLAKLEENNLFDDLELWEQRNRNFHWALISACTSKWLQHFYNTLYDQHKRYRNISLSANLGQRHVQDEHRRIYEAALARDIETACKETELHIMQTAEITQQVLRERLGLQP
ncbi:GntR family transcriptional regulator [Thiolinea disciformis]|uniref:GntR family transcriptional regulator n=1 Tax=Thiolinea disciformis TaxID=125614 RepID=UPI000526B84F|nr:FCD domain-containing protein [Thiolinea disciformis]